jgi:hypothetical protein
MRGDFGQPSAGSIWLGEPSRSVSSWRGWTCDRPQSASATPHPPRPGKRYQSIPLPDFFPPLAPTRFSACFRPLPPVPPAVEACDLGRNRSSGVISALRAAMTARRPVCPVPVVVASVIPRVAGQRTPLPRASAAEMFGERALASAARMSGRPGRVLAVTVSGKQGPALVAGASGTRRLGLAAKIAGIQRRTPALLGRCTSLASQ